MATLTKRKRLAYHNPPVEIVSNTKARRAWLEQKAAEINALPLREAKVVGVGSYQQVVEYEIIETSGRVQMRGTCQACGGLYAVESDGSGPVAYHGYKRPGDGQTYGGCAGCGKLPAEKSIAFTKWLLSVEHPALDATRKELAKVEADKPVYSPDLVFKSPAEWHEFYKQRDNHETAVRKLRNRAWGIEQYIKHLEQNVLPQHNKPLTEVIIA